MKESRVFRGHTECTLTNDNLTIHTRDSQNYIPAGEYFIGKGKIKDFNYVFLFPKQELLQELLSHLSKGRGLLDTKFLNLNDLEEIVLNSGTNQIILPQSAIEYLSLSDKSRLYIIGIYNYFQIWELEVLVPCRNSISIPDLRKYLKTLNL